MKTAKGKRLNPQWKNAVDKALHLSIMNGHQNVSDEEDVDDEESVDTDEEAGSANSGDDDHDDMGESGSDHGRGKDKGEDSESEEGEEEDDDDDDLPSQRRSGLASRRSHHRQPKRRPDASIRHRLKENRQLQHEEKMELLGKLQYFTDEKGFRPLKVLGMQDAIEDIRYEFFRAQRELNKKRNVRMMQKGLVTLATLIETGTSYYNPLSLQLEGYSKSLLLSIRDYDEIFEELHWKYSSMATMPPELRLIMTMASSVWFFHMSNHGSGGPVTSVPGPTSNPEPPPRAPPARPTVPVQRPQADGLPQRKMRGPGPMPMFPMGPSSGGGHPGMDMATLMGGLSMVQTLLQSGGGGGGGGGFSL